MFTSKKVQTMNFFSSAAKVHEYFCHRILHKQMILMTQQHWQWNVLEQIQLKTFASEIALIAVIKNDIYSNFTIHKQEEVDEVRHKNCIFEFPFSRSQQSFELVWQELFSSFNFQENQKLCKSLKENLIKDGSFIAVLCRNFMWA